MQGAQGIGPQAPPDRLFGRRYLGPGVGADIDLGPLRLKVFAKGVKTVHCFLVGALTVTAQKLETVGHSREGFVS